MVQCGINIRKWLNELEKITSVSNSKIKFVNSLQQKNVRLKENLFLCEGLRLCETAIDSSFEIQTAFLTQKMLDDSRGKSLVEKLNDRICFEVSDQVFRKISETDNPQGILFVMKIPSQHVDSKKILDRKNALIVCLDRIQDPGNLGTILRTSLAVGVDGIFLIDGSVDIYSGKSIRSSMGAIFRLPNIVNISRDEFLNITTGRNVFSTTANAPKKYFDVDFSNETILVFGNEANGIDTNILDRSQKISIPMKNSVESLNVAVSASIILYEVSRQRFSK